MVSQGNFSLRLINASTMEPLKEHSSSTGKTYVTLTSNVDFLVQLEASQAIEKNQSIFYQTFVSNAATTTRHNFKRRQNLNSTAKPSIYRFDRSSTQAYESVAMEKVTVRVFEATANGGRRHLETLTMHCCVLPSFQPSLPGRATSLGSLLASGMALSNHPRNSSLLKKSRVVPAIPARSRLTPDKMPMPPMVSLSQAES